MNDGAGLVRPCLQQHKTIGEHTVAAYYQVPAQVLKKITNWVKKIASSSFSSCEVAPASAQLKPMFLESLEYEDNSPPKKAKALKNKKQKNKDHNLQTSSVHWKIIGKRSRESK